jgi:hypothetical protein
LELENHHEKYHRPSRRFYLKESAFKKSLVTFRYNFLWDDNNFDEAQNSIKGKIVRQILSATMKRMITKVSLIFIAEMAMVDHQGEKVTKAYIPFRAGNFLANSLNPRNIEKNVRNSFMKQRMELDEFMKGGSNWQFIRGLAFDIELAEVKPLRGGANVDISGFLNKKHLYNPKSKNNQCFLFCIAYFLLFAGTVGKTKITMIDEIDVKKRAKKFQTAGINFPMSVLDIKKFIKLNPKLDLRVNLLYQSTENKIYPMEYGIGKGTRIVNILLVETSAGSHYMLIKDADNYLKKVYNTGTSKKLSYQDVRYCLNCFNHFRTDAVRDKHLKICSMHKPRIECVPDPDENVVKFKNYEYQHELEHIAYLDFECVLPDLDDKCETCLSLKCKCDTSFIKNLNQQEPIAYSFVVIGPDNFIVHEKTYSGPKAHEHFLEHLLEEEDRWISGLLQTKQVMNFSPDDEIDFKLSTECYLCGKLFDESTMKCRDHSHLNSSYLGAACTSCNLRRKKQATLKIFMHNGSRYDMHFIVKAMAKFRDDITNINVLPYNGENFRMLRFNSFEFLDSLSFLQASLCELSDELKNSGHDYPILKQTYLTRKNKEFNQKRFDMCLSKSFFPYEFCKSFEQMTSTVKLPKRSEFYSSLSEDKISKIDHKFAQTVWSEFNCKNLISYAELYCKIDTILLAEIFQAFRQKMMKFSGLDPAYYISLPAYGYDSMLKITKQEIELPTNIDIVHFLEECKRGGVSFINTRYLQSTQIDQKDILYIDRNNLYGEAQMAKLPHKNFRWLTANELKNFKVSEVECDDDVGYIVECDLHYPKRLHKSHSNLPLAPELLEVSFDNLSPYSKNAILESGSKETYKDVKLMSTFHDRKNYVTHIKNLQLYLSLGMELLKIHRVLKFEQTEIIAPYIEKTTDARKKASSKFEMDMFKKLVSLHMIILKIISKSEQVFYQ